MAGDRESRSPQQRKADEELEAEGLEDSVKGKAKTATGRVKDAVGGLTGDAKLQVEGKIDQVRGKVQDTIGKAKRAIARDDE